MSFLVDWNAKCLARWIENAKAGRHDRECEQQERSSLCHCHKRAREAKGDTALPTEDLYFPPPGCPVCYGGLEFDGDGFDCGDCALSWDRDGAASSVSRTDEFGDLADERRSQFGARLVDLYPEVVA